MEKKKYEKNKDYDKEKYVEEQKKKMDELFNNIGTEIEKIKKGGVDEYKKFITALGKFYDYSIQNTLLIQSQNEDARLVASFNSWKSKGRAVRKGERGLKIRVPVPIKDKEDEEKSFIYFKIGTVFDISQTVAMENQPQDIMIDGLQGDVKNFNTLYEAIVNVAGCQVEKEAPTDGAHGIYQYNILTQKDKILLQGDLSEKQQIKTLIHELAHLKLHKNNEELDKADKEIQAESVAFIVCNRLGIDTGDYSFRYLSSYMKDKDTFIEMDNGIKKEKNKFIESADVIKKESVILYDDITKEYEILNEINKEKDMEKTEIKEVSKDIEKKIKNIDNEVLKKYAEKMKNVELIEVTKELKQVIEEKVNKNNKETNINKNKTKIKEREM